MHLAEDWPPPGRGLPIGSYLSQLFAAHVYLNGLDHMVKRRLKVPGSVRYMDDFFLFGSQRGFLRRWRSEVRDWLWQERGLLLKHPQARILSCRGTLDALGYRIRREGLEARPRAFKRFQRRVVQEIASPRDFDPDFERSVRASMGVILF